MLILCFIKVKIIVLLLFFLYVYLWSIEGVDWFICVLSDISFLINEIGLVLDVKYNLVWLNLIMVLIFILGYVIIVLIILLVLSFRVNVNVVWLNLSLLIMFLFFVRMFIINFRLFFFIVICRRFKILNDFVIWY